MIRNRRRRPSAHPSGDHGPTTAPDPDAPTRWPERRVVASVIRVLVFLAPVVFSFLVALALSRAIDVPADFWARVGRWVVIAVVATVAMLATQRVLRRLLPLAALFSLTLVFPDETPSRFGVALRGMSARRLERRVESIEREGLGETPSEAAETLLEVVAALSVHDRMTRGHSERVRAYAVMLGEEMDLPAEEIDALRWAGLLHDVGKLHVPREILNKPDLLTEEEFAVVRQHPEAGRALVAPLADWLGPSAAAVYEHHERWEGGGYPTGISGEQLSMASRIVAVADAFDVMTSTRSYKPPVSASEARSELQRCAGTQFDPAVVRAMMNISLGRLWRTMGPLSWVAQLGLFPRPIAQAGPAVNVAVAALVALLLTGLAGMSTSARDDVLAQPAPVEVSDRAVDGDPDEPSSGGSDGGDGATEEEEAADAPAPGEPSDTTESTLPSNPLVDASDEPIVAQLTPIITTPPGTTVASRIVPTRIPVIAGTTTSSTTNPSIVTTPPSTVATTTGSATTTTTTATTNTTSTTVVTTTATTTTPTTTTTATTTTTTTIPPTTTTSTTTTTTTTVPPTPGVFVLSAGGVGNRVSTELLTMQPERPPANVALPNYDTDRNDDPGLTVVATPQGLTTGVPGGVQTWLLPTAANRLAGPVTLEIWLAPNGPVGTGQFRVLAGLFDCDLGRTDCDLVVRDSPAIAATAGTFAAVTFDLAVLTPYDVAPGRRLELRVATQNGSSNDAWLGYDSVATPARLVIG